MTNPMIRPLALTTILALAACGGAGGGDEGDQTGTVTITVGDGPTDDYSQIIMVIAEIRFLSNGGQDILVLDEPKTIDFLQVRNFSEVLIKREVVAGTFNKIRLILDRLTVVDHAGVARDVALNGLRKIDVNPQGSFQVRGGDEIVIDVDVDLDRSIHVVATGNNQIRFRPVIFATINAEPAFDKLFRVQGTIDDLLTTTDDFSVCDIRRTTDDEPRPNPAEVCVTVDPDDDTALFDSEGKPVETVALAAGDPVVIYGKFRPASDVLIPAVIAVGENFSRVRGIAGSDFRAGTEDFDLDQVNDVCLLEPDPYRVTVVEEVPVFQEDAQRNALPVARENIQRCLETEAEGFVVNPASADEFLRSFVVLLGDSAALVQEQLIGSLAAASNAQTFTLTPTAGSEQCVVVDSETEIVEVTSAGDGATVVVGAAVPTSVEVSVIGFRDEVSNCIAADTIIHESA